MLLLLPPWPGPAGPDLTVEGAPAQQLPFGDGTPYLSLLCTFPGKAGSFVFLLCLQDAALPHSHLPVGSGAQPFTWPGHPSPGPAWLAWLCEALCPGPVWLYLGVHVGLLAFEFPSPGLW